MGHASDPLFTVVYPLHDTRGRAAERLATWSRRQTLARDRYRVIAVLTDELSAEEQEVKALLDPQDAVLRLPDGTDGSLWNGAAEHAGAPWLVFTEGHCLADPGCLEAVARWLDTKPASPVGNFLIGHPDDHLLARLSERWFGEVYATWASPGEWPRLLRPGFIIRTDVFRASGGYDPRYGMFAPALLSAKLHAQGIRMEPVPDARVIHIDDDRMSDLDYDTAEYVESELGARSTHDPRFFERYFGHEPGYANQLLARPRIAASVVRAIVAAIVANPRRTRELVALLGPSFRTIASALLPRAFVERLIVACDEFAVAHLPMPSGLRYKWFVAAHARFVRIARRRWVRAHRVADAGDWEEASITELGPGRLSGVHGLEEHAGRPFRWTEPVALLRLAARNAERTLSVETGAIRGNPRASVMAVIADGRVVPPAAIAAAGGTLTVRLPAAPSGVQAQSVIILMMPLVPARSGSPDGRRLGLPVLAVACPPDEAMPLPRSAAA